MTQNFLIKLFSTVETYNEWNLKKTYQNIFILVQLILFGRKIENIAVNPF